MLHDTNYVYTKLKPAAILIENIFIPFKLSVKYQCKKQCYILLFIETVHVKQFLIIQKKISSNYIYVYNFCNNTTFSSVKVFSFYIHNHWGKVDDRYCNYGHPKMADVESGKNLFLSTRIIQSLYYAPAGRYINLVQR